MGITGPYCTILRSVQQYRTNARKISLSKYSHSLKQLQLRARRKGKGLPSPNQRLWGYQTTSVNWKEAEKKTKGVPSIYQWMWLQTRNPCHPQLPLIYIYIYKNDIYIYDIYIYMTLRYPIRTKMELQPHVSGHPSFRPRPMVPKV